MQFTSGCRCFVGMGIGATTGNGVLAEAVATERSGEAFLERVIDSVSINLREVLSGEELEFKFVES